MSGVVHVNFKKASDLDDEAVASLLRDVKMIAAKEIERDHDSKSTLRDRSPLSIYHVPTNPVLRGRRISFATEELTIDPPASLSATLPPSSPVSVSTMKQPKAIPPALLDHHDWSSHVGSYSQQLKFTIKKKSKRKDETFVGQVPKAKIRATLRQKFSWKQYPELERFLLSSQRAYFEFSSRNYTPEQRNFNNTLTRELLELASNQGYAFEGFTFAMIRDRIRCYFKSYVQSAKKRGIIVGYAGAPESESIEYRRAPLGQKRSSES